MKVFGTIWTFIAVVLVALVLIGGGEARRDEDGPQPPTGLNSMSDEPQQPDAPKGFDDVPQHPRARRQLPSPPMPSDIPMPGRK